MRVCARAHACTLAVCSGGSSCRDHGPGRYLGLLEVAPAPGEAVLHPGHSASSHVMGAEVRLVSLELLAFAGPGKGSRSEERGFPGHQSCRHPSPQDPVWELGGVCAAPSLWIASSSSPSYQVSCKRQASGSSGCWPGGMWCPSWKLSTWGPA